MGDQGHLVLATADKLNLMITIQTFINLLMFCSLDCDYISYTAKHSRGKLSRL